jgi:hypothetical protein
VGEAPEEGSTGDTMAEEGGRVLASEEDKYRPDTVACLRFGSSLGGMWRKGGREGWTGGGSAMMIDGSLD